MLLSIMSSARLRHSFLPDTVDILSCPEDRKCRRSTGIGVDGREIRQVAYKAYGESLENTILENESFLIGHFMRRPKAKRLSRTF